ncbi:MAG: amino acid permease [Parvularculaceae bacterium]
MTVGAPKTQYGFIPAVAVIIANMIGTGVFTSLGFQLADLSPGFPILLLWALGGLAAFCGAMSYAEIGAALPRSGGEYSLLREIYHPAAGFVSGFVSSTVAFSAPIALAAITFSAYGLSAAAPDASDMARKALAVALVAALALIHASRRRVSGGLQALFTAIKVATIVLFCAGAALFLDTPQPVSFLPQAGDGAVVASGAFAISLIYVSYAYAGWNAATYITGEIENPTRNLPRILALGSGVVAVLYVALNASFMAASPASELAGKVEVGFIAATSIFGEAAGKAVGLVMASLLISTVSAMTIAGPRVLQAIGEDFPLFRPLAKVNRDAIPARAIYAQAGLAILFIVTSSFQSILVFAGFLTALNSFLAVLGLFVLRVRRPDLPRPFRTPFFPATPLVYLIVTGWTLVYAAISRPVEIAFAAGLIAVGVLAFWVSSRPLR